MHTAPLPPEPERNTLRHVLSLPVIVAALGYFVDIYDLVLFSIVRVPSLKALGLEGQALIDQGVFLLNMQMAGMLLGGILWGILGDRKGRLKIMFASIFLYSVANLANAAVSSAEDSSGRSRCTGFSVVESFLSSCSARSRERLPGVPSSSLNVSFSTSFFSVRGRNRIW